MSNNFLIPYRKLRIGLLRRCQHGVSDVFVRPFRKNPENEAALTCGKQDEPPSCFLSTRGIIQGNRKYQRSPFVTPYLLTCSTRHRCWVLGRIAAHWSMLCCFPSHALAQHQSWDSSQYLLCNPHYLARCRPERLDNEWS